MYILGQNLGHDLSLYIKFHFPGALTFSFVLKSQPIRTGFLLGDTLYNFRTPLKLSEFWLKSPSWNSTLQLYCGKALVPLDTLRFTKNWHWNLPSCELLTFCHLQYSYIPEWCYKEELSLSCLRKSCTFSHRPSLTCTEKMWASWYVITTRVSVRCLIH